MDTEKNNSRKGESLTVCPAHGRGVREKGKNNVKTRLTRPASLEMVPETIFTDLAKLLNGRQKLCNPLRFK